MLNALGSDEGCPELALPALGGLFVPANAVEGDGSHPGLLRGRDVTLSNRRLLAAVRHLTRVEDEAGAGSRSTTSILTPKSWVWCTSRC